ASTTSPRCISSPSPPRTPSPPIPRRAWAARRRGPADRSMPGSISDAAGATSHEIELAVEPRSAFAPAVRAAERWGAELEPDGGGASHGRLRLPVTAGLRRGWLAGSLGVDPVGPAGSRMVFQVAESDYHLQLGSVAVLAIGAAGALVVVLWPFFPQLTPLAPFGALLALCAWFLVARLHGSGPEEFLETVAATAAETGRAAPP